METLRQVVSAISIHALLAESDMIHPRSCNAKSNFYPRSPCGERLICTNVKVPLLDFYPRSPCGERHGTRTASRYIIRFLSTLSLRRATADCYLDNIEINISIHALLAESDVAPVLAIGRA